MMWLQRHIEYPIGFISAALSSIGLSEVFMLSVNGVISICIGVSMIVATHFVKRYMHKKYPIK